MKAVGGDWLEDLKIAQKAEQQQLYPALQLVLDETRRVVAIEQRELGTLIAGKRLRVVVQDVATRLGLELLERELDALIELIQADRQGFGVLQALADDDSVSDIIVTSFSEIVAQRNRSNERVPMRFASEQDYENFVERLLHQAGASYSTRSPIADGMIADFARVHAVHKSICTGGPYLTIRFNRFSSITVDELVEHGTGSREMFEYLRGCVRAGLSMLLVGEVGTGKTTLARAVANIIPRSDSILVIEDTPEIKLNQPFVRYMQTRVSNSEGEGRVSPAQCIRAGMRMAMNRIIFGEIRDAEAAESFVDCCASGHPGLSTIHGRNAADSITRMMLFLGRAQPNVSRDVLMRQVVTAVQLVVHVGLCQRTGKRRILEIRELGGIADDTIRQRTLFKYEVKDGLFGWSVGSRSSMFDIGSDMATCLSELPGFVVAEGGALWS